MRTYNFDIRELIDKSEIQYKDIAATMGVSSVYLSRIMCAPLTNKNRKRILAAIEQLNAEHEG